MFEMKSLAEHSHILHLEAGEEVSTLKVMAHLQMNSNRDVRCMHWSFALQHDQRDDIDSVSSHHLAAPLTLDPSLSASTLKSRAMMLNMRTIRMETARMT